MTSSLQCVSVCFVDGSGEGVGDAHVLVEVLDVLSLLLELLLDGEEPESALAGS